MNAQLQQNHFKYEYSADELSEFILQLDEYGLDPELTDDEYHIYNVRTGNLVAFFSEIPTSGPAGGWIQTNQLPRQRSS